jgi:hypothetical protein
VGVVPLPTPYTFVARACVRVRELGCPSGGWFAAKCVTAHVSPHLCKGCPVGDGIPRYGTKTSAWRGPGFDMPSVSSPVSMHALLASNQCASHGHASRLDVWWCVGL